LCGIKSAIERKGEIMKQKKVLFDGRFLSLSHAGIGRYSCELFKAICMLDNEIDLVLLVTTGTSLDKDLLEAIGERKNKVEVVETSASHYSVKEQTYLLGLIKKVSPDLIHFPHFNHPVFYNGNFVVTIHDLTLSQYAERGNIIKRQIYKNVINHAARASQKILTVSNFVKAEIAKEFNLPDEKIVTTYNAIDRRFTRSDESKIKSAVLKYKIRRPYILSVGQWRSHKNLLRLVDAFKMLKKYSKFDDLKLVFVGREDPKYPQLPDHIKQLNLQHDVKFTGFVSDDDLPDIYSGANVFCFPSLSEGFGLPGLEAQACGTPVVSSERTCMREIYADGAVYFNPENTNDICQKLSLVLSDSSLAKKIATLGIENSKRFTWEKTAKKTLEVYREILYK
jgi:glycosyltransferase involved in cell wall biosynthesis